MIRDRQVRGTAIEHDDLDVLPGGATLAPGERILVDDQFMFSTVAFYLKTELSLTTRRLYAVRPNTLLRLIPVGTARSNFPIENIAGVSAGTRFDVLGVIFGLVGLLFGLAALALPYPILGVILILLGLASIIGAPKQAIEVMNSGGGRIVFPVSVLERGRTLEFASAVSEAIAGTSRAAERSSPQPSQSAVSTDPGDALRKLDRLRADRLITEDEYSTKRSEILRRL